MKAESDYCCTSGNARAVIESIPADREILFLPDLYLGLWLERVTGRKLRSGSASATSTPGSAPPTSSAGTRDAPDAELLVHPECGCASQAMAFGNERTQILSTEGMVEFARRSPKERFLVATETGILHRLTASCPGKRFEAVREDAVCRFMKMITLEKLRDALRDRKHEVTVDPELAARAARPRSTAWSRSAERGRRATHASIGDDEDVGVRAHRDASADADQA